MHELLGLNAEQIATIGTSIGVLIAAIVTAFRGFKARPKEPVVDIPKAAIPHELKDQFDDMQNRVAHTERKVDQALSRLSDIYMDTQILRAMKN